MFFSLFSIFVSLQVQAGLPPEIQTITSKNRLQLDPEWDLDEKLAEFSKLLYPFTSYEDAPVIRPLPDKTVQRGLSITKKSAVEDVEFLFSLLKHSYALYQYFGGDEVFLAAKRDILAEFDQHDLPIINMALFEDIIARHLAFINDGHFVLNGRRFLKQQAMYMDFNSAFIKDNTGYYREGKNGREYVQSVNGQEPEQFLQPSLGSEGTIVYRLGVLEFKGRRSIWLDLDFDMAGNKSKQSIKLKEIRSSRLAGDPVYQHRKVDGIPVLSIRAFPFSGPQGLGFDEETYRLMQDFFDDAYGLRDTKMLVLDLRSHQGGDSSNGQAWIRNFTDFFFQDFPYIAASLATSTSEKVRRAYNSLVGRSVAAHRMVSYVRESGWFGPIYQLPRQIPNDTYIAVLTDSYIGSAGELFLESLKQVDNVIIVGTNSAGIYLASGGSLQLLPNSQLKISYGSQFRLALDFIDREGLGVLPDFWVHPDEAEALALKFLQTYFQ